MRTFRTRHYATGISGTVLAVLFACIGLGVSIFETWFPSWEVKAGEEAPVTVRLPSRYFRITLLRNEFHYLSTTSSNCPHLVPRGARLKKRGECAGLVTAFETARRQKTPMNLAGVFSFYLIVGLLLTALMRHQSMGRSRFLRGQATVFGLLILLMVVTKAILLLTGLPALVVPTVTVPLLAAYYFQRQLALTMVVTATLITSSLNNFDVELLLVHGVSGITAITALNSARRRAHVHLKAGAFASWMAVFFTVITTLVFAGTLDVHDDVAEHADPRYSLWIASLIGGLGSGILAWMLTPLTGWLVGEVSRGTLLDLQDLDQRLLKRIRERAPGTWEHSRAMANLAEAAANAIGGNALLVRVGAYYHDVGKSNGPEYFIENQAGGPNPHDDLAPDESASRIFRHVTEGTRMLRAEEIPEDVIEFCYSHHGSSLLEYFWHKNQAAGNPGELSEKDFIYPGHRPTTRETGILMVVDAIEAGARTVDVPDKDTFQTLVQRIVFFKLSQGQLDQSGISLSDLRVVVNTLVDTLVNMYHERIKYPWQTGDTGSISLQKRESEAPPPPPSPNGEPQPSQAAAAAPAPTRTPSQPPVAPAEPTAQAAQPAEQEQTAAASDASPDAAQPRVPQVPTVPATPAAREEATNPSTPTVPATPAARGEAANPSTPTVPATPAARGEAEPAANPSTEEETVKKTETKVVSDVRATLPPQPLPPMAQPKAPPSSSTATDKVVAPHSPPRSTKEKDAPSPAPQPKQDPAPDKPLPGTRPAATGTSKKD